MRKLDVVVKKFKKQNKSFPGTAYLHFNKCPSDYGMEDAIECRMGNHKYSCKRCWSEEVI